MDNTITMQGAFTSTGANKQIVMRSDVDWMHVINLSQTAGSTQDVGVEFWWQREMANYDGVCYYHAAASQALSSTTCATLAVNGFSLYDTSSNPYGNNVAITRIPANGVVLTANTTGLYVGSVVRFNNVLGGLQHCNDMLYSVTNVVPNTSFTIVPATNNVDTGVTTGNYQQVYFPELFYPRNRKITNINNATGVVTTAIPHGLAIGQKVRFVIPTVTATAYGITELDGAIATVTSVPTNWTFGIDIDTTAYNAFAFPLTADVPFTYAQVIPVGEDTAQALTSSVSTLTDAVYNTGSIGIMLFAGDYGPAGNNGDVIKWVAGKSFATNIG